MFCGPRRSCGTRSRRLDVVASVYEREERMTNLPRRAPGLIGLFVLLAMVATAAGCGGNKAATSAADTSPVKRASLRAGQAVPRPKGHDVLAIHGAIGSTNVGGRLEFDIATLDRMGLESIDLYEPFKKKRMQFEAIPLRNLLAVAKLGNGTVKLHTVALNDYSVDIPVDVARGDGVYLATHNGDGSPIPVAKGGPIRIVFLDGAAGGNVQNYWIWSLDAMEVK
jgi:hypothetical protein